MGRVVHRCRSCQHEVVNRDEVIPDTCGECGGDMDHDCDDCDDLGPEDDAEPEPEDE